MSTPEPEPPKSPERVKAFARFFKNYMSISSVVVASLPIPVTTLGLIPTYKAQSAVLSVYTPLFCFLMLGFIFYIRHFLARAMFPEALERIEEPMEPYEPEGGEVSDSDVKRYEKARSRYDRDMTLYNFRQVRIVLRRFLISALPFVCIIASVAFMFLYHVRFSDSLQLVRRDPALQFDLETRLGRRADATIAPVPSTFKEIVGTMEIDRIPLGTGLMLFYIAFFVAAEAAFILMAIKEYIQDLMGYKEKDLISRSHRLMGSDESPAPPKA